MSKKKFKKIFVAGTFDHFHMGHQYFLWSASSLAEEMVVVIARDETVLRIKDLAPTFSELERLSRVEREIFPNAQIRLGRSDRDFLKTLEEENPDVLFLGFDQRFVLNDEQQEEFFKKRVILRAEPYFPEFFKSSKFRSKIAE
jgi:FAD synthetase